MKQAHVHYKNNKQGSHDDFTKQGEIYMSLLKTMPTVEVHGTETVELFKVLDALEGVNVIDSNDMEFDAASEPQNIYTKVFVNSKKLRGFLYLNIQNGCSIRLDEALEEKTEDGEVVYRQGECFECDVNDWEKIVDEIKWYLH